MGREQGMREGEQGTEACSEWTFGKSAANLNAPRPQFTLFGREAISCGGTVAPVDGRQSFPRLSLIKSHGKLPAFISNREQ